MEGRSSNTGAEVQRHVHLTPRKSLQLGSHAAKALVVVASLKHVNCLSTVPIWGSDIFSLLENCYFLAPPHTPVFHTVQRYLLQIYIAPTLAWQEGTQCLLQLFGETGMVIIKTITWFYLIYSLCARLKQVLILAERVSLSLLIVPERLETKIWF